jgi:predicted lysophospholipase L1 biosynthesis ABC-type transport system permease subunit
MRLRVLLTREVGYRKANFAAGVAALAAGIACLVAAVAFLQEHRQTTEQIIAAKMAASRERLAQYGDEVRKLTKDMGFNVLILPRGLDLNQLYVEGFPEAVMPEEYAERLASSGLATINHVLPSLQQRVKWTEASRTVFVMGVRGEVWIASKNQTPILEPVTAGTLWLGYELHQGLGLRVGDPVTFLGQPFTVARCQPEKGSRDDVTVWMNLAQAQHLLGKPGRINAILALECNCASVDRIGEIRAEIGRILPDTQVIEYQTQALARAEARNRAAALAQEEITRELDHRRDLGRQKEILAAVIVSLVLVAAGVWTGFLAFHNVQERRTEIGVLTAHGISAWRIVLLLLARAVLSGVLGAGIGHAAGLSLARIGSSAAAMPAVVRDLMGVRWTGSLLLVAGALAAIAAWLPALWAVRQDPAEALRDD